MVSRFRDLLVLEPAGRLVVACDSLGGIGPKPADTVLCDAVTAAHFAVRVPLLEVLCTGAKPISLVDALCVEADPTGRPMIEEIRRVAVEAGIDAAFVTGSTEDNVPTSATAIGITVLGVLGADQSLPRARSGDVVICAGLPISAPEFEIFVGHPDQVSVAEVRAVLGSGLVHDALPVGSHGVGFEVAEMARVAGLDAGWRTGCGVVADRSAGPASCILFACPPDRVDSVAALLAPDRPLNVVADLGDRP